VWTIPSQSLTSPVRKSLLNLQSVAWPLSWSVLNLCLVSNHLYVAVSTSTLQWTPHRDWRRLVGGGGSGSGGRKG